MRAKVIASSGCRDGSCPTLYRVATPAGTQVVVQGYTVTNANDVLPEGESPAAGETVITIPADVFEHLVQQYVAERAQA